VTLHDAQDALRDRRRSDDNVDLVHALPCPIGVAEKVLERDDLPEQGGGLARSDGRLDDPRPVHDDGQQFQPGVAVLLIAFQEFRPY